MRRGFDSRKRKVWSRWEEEGKKEMTVKRDLF